MKRGRPISSAVVDRLGWTLIHSLWQGIAVAGVLALVLLFTRRRSPQLRYLCSLGELVSIVGLMAATYAVLAPPVPQAAESVAATRPGLPRMVEAPRPRAIVRIPSAPVPAAATGSSTWTWSKSLEPLMPWLVGLWACGVLALSTWHAGGWLAAQRLRPAGRLAGGRRTEGLAGPLATAAGRPPRWACSSRAASSRRWPWACCGR